MHRFLRLRAVGLRCGGSSREARRLVLSARSDDRGISEELIGELSEDAHEEDAERGDAGDEQSVFDHGGSVFFASELAGGFEELVHGRELS